MRFSLVFAGLLAVSTTSFASVSVTLDVSPKRVTVGQSTTITITVEGTGALTWAPDIPGFDTLASDAQKTAFFEKSSVIQEIGSGGVLRRVRQEFSRLVVPGKGGTYSLGPVNIQGVVSTGVILTVTERPSPDAPPLPRPLKPGDERVAVENLDLAPATPQPEGSLNPWLEGARKNPLPWIATICGLALLWLAARTYTFLKKIEELSVPEIPLNPVPPEPQAVAGNVEGVSFADQAVALVRQRIGQAVGRDVSHLAGAELADMEPHDEKRELVREALRLADAVRFGQQVGIEDEVRRLLKEYLA